jgi:hypothetical protein
MNTFSCLTLYKFEHRGAIRFQELCRVDHLFKDGKIATRGDRIAGYIITGLGVLVTPTVLIAVNPGFIFAFYYWPENKYLMKCSYSDNLAAPSSHGKNFNGETGALFAKKDKQVKKLFAKFSSKLDDILVNLEKELAAR